MSRGARGSIATKKSPPIKLSVGSRKRRRRPPNIVGGVSSGLTPRPPPSSSSSSVPRLFRSPPLGVDGRDLDATATGTGVRDGRVKDKDEFGSLLLPEGTGGAEDVPCDVLLALRSLVRRGAAAVCAPAAAASRSYSPPPPPSSSDTPPFRGAPFVLRPMLFQSLLSKVSSSSTRGRHHPLPDDCDPNAAEEANRIAAANASTGLNVEMDEMRRRNVVRIMQLHGTGDAEGDAAIMETDHYVAAALDAFAASAAGGTGGGVVAAAAKSSLSPLPAATEHLSQTRNIARRESGSLHRSGDGPARR